jgi:hypothetical protein
MLFMTHATTAVETSQVRKIVLVPSTASGRGDEMVRRYRLARLRLVGREASTAARRLPPARGG